LELEANQEHMNNEVKITGTIDTTLGYSMVEKVRVSE